MTILGHSFHEFNITVLVFGATIFVNGLLTDVCTRYLPASQFTISMLTGIIIGPEVLNLIDINTWAPQEDILENAARFVVGIQVFALTLRLPFDFIEKAWKNILFLVLPFMFLTWMTCSFLIYAITSSQSTAPTFTIWESLVCGASVSTTDPVLASAVATSRLTQHLVPKRLRYLISAESALNEGVIVIFADFAIEFVLYSAGKALKNWGLKIFLYECGVAVVISLVFGVTMGHLMRWAEPGKLHDKQLIVALTVAFTSIIIGGFDLLGINSMLGITIAGVSYSLIVEGKERSSDSLIQETVDLIFTTPLFILVGTTLPFHEWGRVLGAERCVLLIVTIFLLRRLPWMMLFGRIFLRKTLESWADTAFVGWFGPIGIGSIYHTFHAVRYTNINEIWTINSLLLFTSVIIFGATDTILLKAYTTLSPEHRKKMEIRQSVIESQISWGRDGDEYEEDMTDEELEEAERLAMEGYDMDEVEEREMERRELSPKVPSSRRRSSIFPAPERYIPARRRGTMPIVIDPENEEVIPVVREHESPLRRRKSVISSTEGSPRVNFDRRLSFYSPRYYPPSEEEIHTSSEEEYRDDNKNTTTTQEHTDEDTEVVAESKNFENTKNNPPIYSPTTESISDRSSSSRGSIGSNSLKRRESGSERERENGSEKSKRDRKKSLATGMEYDSEERRLSRREIERIRQQVAERTRRKKSAPVVLPPSVYSPSIFPRRDRTPVFRRASFFDFFHPKETKPAVSNVSEQQQQQQQQQQEQQAQETSPQSSSPVLSPVLSSSIRRPLSAHLSPPLPSPLSVSLSQSLSPSLSRPHLPPHPSSPHISPPARISSPLSSPHVSSTAHLSHSPISSPRVPSSRVPRISSPPVSSSPRRLSRLSSPHLSSSYRSSPQVSSPLHSPQINTTTTTTTTNTSTSRSHSPHPES